MANNLGAGFPENVQEHALVKELMQLSESEGRVEAGAATEKHLADKTVPDAELMSKPEGASPSVSGTGIQAGFSSAVLKSEQKPVVQRHCAA